MTKRIFKYQAAIPMQTFQVPCGQVLRVDIQGRCWTAWVLVDETDLELGQEIVIVATGEAIPAKFLEANYVSTMLSGGFVFHAFVRPLP